MKKLLQFLIDIIRGNINFKMLRYQVHHRGLGRSNIILDDDFDWNEYTLHYEGELEIGEKRRTLALQTDDYMFSQGKLVRKHNILPLHPNVHLLYETILQLSPRTILEVGCGGGDNIHNLNTLEPKLSLFGIDISQKQLDLLSSRHPRLSYTTKVADITQNNFFHKPVELVYTQAVIMHIGEKNQRHMIALENMFKTATSYIVLMENWEKHHFVNNINSLIDNGKIPWDNCFFYYRKSDDHTSIKLLIISNKKLNYEPLLSYDTLLKQKSPPS